MLKTADLGYTDRYSQWGGFNGFQYEGKLGLFLPDNLESMQIKNLIRHKG